MYNEGAKNPQHYEKVIFNVGVDYFCRYWL